MSAKDSATTRFSDRVDDYVKYRPHYPVEIIDLLAARFALTPESIIADVGAGTGLSAKLLLENGNPVIGVEPNREMREAGEHCLREFARYQTLDGTAEHTRLPTHGVDFIICAQAFHWFDRDKTRVEFKRALKEEGYCVLLWNDRRTDSTPFLRDYEALLNTYALDYKEINHKNVQERDIFTAFFGGEFFEARFDNVQRFDFEGLLGRLHSSSYVPAKTHPNYAPMVAEATRLFELHAQSGVVSFEYDTRVYVAPMT